MEKIPEMISVLCQAENFMEETLMVYQHFKTIPSLIGVVGTLSAVAYFFGDFTL